jgi:hypothetical protein
MESNKLDLNQLVSQQGHQLSITPTESQAERESRLRIEEAKIQHQHKLDEANAAHQRRKEMVLVITGSVLITAVVGLCLWLVAKKGLTAEEGKLAFGLLTTIAAGYIGYLTGRSSK